MTDSEFKCESCGEVFCKSVSDEVSIAQYEKRFPGQDIVDAALICDGCFKEFQEWAAKQGNVPDNAISAHEEEA